VLLVVLVTIFSFMDFPNSLNQKLELLVILVL